MSTVAQRPAKLPARAQHRVAVWLLGAVLVAVIATTLALALIGSGAEQNDRGVEASQPAPQGPTTFGGARP
jgi:hypothetical protein